MSKPTREQIETAALGQLRIWCAEMMGWARHPRYEGWLPPSKSLPNNLPAFPTNIAAAWQIVDKLTSTTKQRFRLEVYSTGSTATFEELDKKWEYDDENAPLAICRAALLWWIEQPEA